MSVTILHHRAHSLGLDFVQLGFDSRGGRRVDMDLCQLFACNLVYRLVYSCELGRVAM